MSKILAKHTSKEVEQIEKDSDRDYYMTAEEAKEYGIVDRVIEFHKDTEEEKKSA